MLMRPFLSAQDVFYMNRRYMYMLTGTRSSQISHELWQPNFVGNPVTPHHLRNQFPIRPRPFRPIISRRPVCWQQDQKEFYSTKKEIMDCNDSVLSKCDVALCQSTSSSRRDIDGGCLTNDEFKANSNRSPKEYIEQSTTLTEIKKSFSCPQCKYSTDRKNNLKRHIITMHFDCDRKLECCGASFRSKAKLREHVILFHKDGYRCMTCGRTFCRKALLRRHMAVHSGKKDFLCSLCDYATSHKSNLERHQKVHQKSKGLDNCGNTRQNSHRKAKRTNAKYKYRLLQECVDDDRRVPKIHDPYIYEPEFISDLAEAQSNQNRFSLYSETTTQNVFSSPYYSDYSSHLIAYTDEKSENVVSSELNAGCNKDENGNDINTNDNNRETGSETRQRESISNSQGICCLSDYCVNGYEKVIENSFRLTENESKKNDEESQDSLKANDSNVDETSSSEANNPARDDYKPGTESDSFRLRHKYPKRLCVQPYRCAGCRLRFRSQADFHCHVCRDADKNLVGKSDTAYSLVAQIIKLGHL